jgi:Cu/Ag efflux protein CusF
MKALVGVLLVGLLAASAAWAPATFGQAQAPAGAPAAEKQIEGKVQSVDPVAKTVTLEDGTTLMVREAAMLKDIQPGRLIKASYREQGGSKVATSLQVEKQ